MELKVWVEGIQRIVCGVTVNTTCQDVVFALAHATGKVGRFTLIERWRHNERLLAPQENPLKLLLKWGEYANDVQFILQRSENKHSKAEQEQKRIEVANAINDGKNNNNNNNNSGSTKTNSSHLRINNSNNIDGGAAPTINSVMLKKPLGLSNTNNNNNNNSNCNYNNGKTTSNNNNNSNSNNLHNSIECAYTLQQQQQQQQQQHGTCDVKQNENIGIVRGIPQQQQQQLHKSPLAMATTIGTVAVAAATTTARISNELPNLIPRHEKSHSNPIELVAHNSHRNGVVAAYNGNNSSSMYSQLGAYNSKSTNEINLTVMRNSLDRRAAAMADQYPNNNNNSQHNNNHNSNGGEQPSPDVYKNAPAISANGALVPPPYRDPPPPRNSPMQMQQQQQAAQPPSTTNPFTSDDYELDYQPRGGICGGGGGAGGGSAPTSGLVESSGESESIFQAAQYNDLLQLIKFQREKINAQQMELSKYDAEIVYLESKEREQAQELEAISREITKADQIFRQGSEQLQTLQYVEEENELVKQQEKTLKSEIALLRSKLANCETELLQCKNKIRLLMDDIEVEQQRATNNAKQSSKRQNVERDFLLEMERIQCEIDQAIHNTDTSNKTTDSLKKEILLIENAIAEKKRQVEQLVNEMKEVNLQSLTVTTSEEIKHLLEGSNKPGSSRRIIGSPRQLENAVPTSKNPHGVWV